jgi:hypothetical protein
LLYPSYRKKGIVCLLNIKNISFQLMPQLKMAKTITDALAINKFKDAATRPCASSPCADLTRIVTMIRNVLLVEFGPQLQSEVYCCVIIISSPPISYMLDRRTLLKASAPRR